MSSDTVTAVIFEWPAPENRESRGIPTEKIAQQKGNAVHETQTISRDGLEQWLLDRIAFYLDKPVDSIDPKVELARYGMDSVYAISIISDIEDHLQVEVDVAKARSRGTVDALTDYLLELVG